MDERRGAIISEDEVYRHALWRVWDASEPLLGWVGLNPSTADGKDDDHTIRKERGFTKEHRINFGGFYKVNLFDYRATDPDDLFKRFKQLKCVTSSENDKAIVAMTERVDVIIVAWGGVHKALRWRIDPVLEFLRASGKPVLCLGRTKDGQPRHPLMLAWKTPFENWTWVK